MKVGIIGSGGREHAICHALNKSNIVKEMFCFPGNAGTATLAKNIDSQLEGSKIFTKKLCQKYNIPTANFGIFKKSHEANEFIKKSKYPLVIKADGLASGKGVYICKTEGDALTAIKEIFDGKFGKAENLLVEEFLEGEEMSYFVVSDGNTIKNFETAQDHKRVLEGDLGKNTGGMGAYSPSRLMNKEIEKKILDKIIKPTIRGLKQAGINYVGFLYAGLMIVKNEPFLIEYNVRMGDPECQVILPKLETDILNIFLACCDGKLNELKIKWHDKKSLCIVLCARGYPDEYKKNILIENLDKIKITNKEYIYHAGTINVENKIYSIGGRVLNFVCLSENFLDARIKILDTIKFLNWDNGFYRKDIGYKVIDK